MIKRSTIDRVFETARVEEVIRDFVQLKKAGSNYKGLSPFTDERTPSFMVSPVKQIWKDFSSGKGGNVVSFLMEHEHFNYPEAIRFLANKYGIEVEETEQTDEEKQAASERESMYLVNTFARDFFQAQLTQTEEGKAIGLTYLKERGFTDESIAGFELGYSPEIWDAFTKAAQEKGYKPEFLEKTGLSIARASEGKKKTMFDRFRGRVMFPIHSMSGRVLGFGGRILSSTKKTAKYLNSSESEVYHKSKVVYGLYQAKQEIAKEDRCYLVEGYTDVIQFHQKEITNTVASSGTALTPGQIRLINRLTQNIVVLYDGDAAGTRASVRGIDLILEEGMNVQVCSFPEGEDPDSFAKRHSKEELARYLEGNAKDFITYKASLLMDEARNNPIKKAEVIRDMMQSVAKIPDEIKQELYLKECVRIMDISEEVLYSTLAQIKAQKETGRARDRKRKKNLEVVKPTTGGSVKVDPQYEIEKHLIRLLLHYGGMAGTFEEYALEPDEDGELVLKAEKREKKVYEKIMLDLQEDEVEFTNTGFRTLYERILTEYKKKQKLAIEDFINSIDPELSAEVTNILMQDERYRLHRWDTVGIYVSDKSELDEREIQQTILNLRTLLIKKKAAELMEGFGEDKSQTHREMLEEIRDYKKLQVIIAHKLDSVVNPSI